MQQQIPDSVAGRLKKVREQAGVTVAELAHKIGYAQTTLSSVENHHDRPSERLFLKWLAALNLNRRWVETGQGEMFAAAAGETSVVEPDLVAPMHFRIQEAKRHAKAALAELDQLERELTVRVKSPKSK